MPLPKGCPGLNTPPELRKGGGRERETHRGLWGTALRSPGVWFQLGGQIPGSQASARGVEGVQSRAQNEEASGIWPWEEAPRRVRGPLGKKPGPQGRVWVPVHVYQLTTVCCRGGRRTWVRCPPPSKLSWPQEVGTTVLPFLLNCSTNPSSGSGEGCPVVEDTICVWQAEGWALGPQDD